MNNIIEKLGVEIESTPCNEIKIGDTFKFTGIMNLDFIDYEENYKGILESLIELYKFYESLSWRSPYVDHEKIKNTIEKATGKPWSEIKELLG